MSTNSMGDGSGEGRQQQIPNFLNFVKPDGASSYSSNLPPQSPLLDRLKQFLPQIAEANAKLEAERAEEKIISAEPQIDGQFDDSDDDEGESVEESSSGEESPSGEESGSGKEDSSEEDDSDQEKTQQQERSSTQFIEFDVHLIREDQPKLNGNEGKKAAPLVEEIEKHGE